MDFYAWVGFSLRHISDFYLNNLKRNASFQLKLIVEFRANLISYFTSYQSCEDWRLGYCFYENVGVLE